MPPPEPDGLNPAAADWSRTARDYYSGAKHLLQIRNFRAAYMQVGFAVECALKASIMRKRGMNRWPSRAERPEFYTHNLGELLAAADLRAEIEAEILAGTRLGEAWMVVKDFDVNQRYPDGRTFPRRQAVDIVEAAGEGGIIVWLTKGI